jgi:chaperonin GroES
VKFQPLGNRVLVERDKVEEKIGDLYLPENSQAAATSGKVVSTGWDVQTLSDGDRVLFGKYAGTEIKVNGVEQLILKEEEVLGILQDEDVTAE